MFYLSQLKVETISLDINIQGWLVTTLLDSEQLLGATASLICPCSEIQKTQSRPAEEQFEMSFQLRIVLDQVTNSKVTTGEDGIINLVTMRPTFIKTTPPSKLSF